MRSQTYRASYDQLPTLLKNLAKYRAFNGSFGYNTEQLAMSVETDLEGNEFTFYVKIPGHVFKNIQSKTFEEALFHDVSVSPV